MKFSKSKPVDILSKEAAETGKDLDSIVKSFLDNADVKSRGNPKDPSEYDSWSFYHDILMVTFPNLQNYWRRGMAFEIMKNCSHFFVIRTSLYPRVYGAAHGTHYFDHVIETSEHLIQRADFFENTGDLAAVYEIDKILRKYTKNGLPVLPAVNIPPTDVELDEVMREALESFAKRSPAKFAKMFNEESVKLGFFHHVKRLEALEHMEESLK